MQRRRVICDIEPLDRLLRGLRVATSPIRTADDLDWAIRTALTDAEAEFARYRARGDLAARVAAFARLARNARWQDEVATRKLTEAVGTDGANLRAVLADAEECRPGETPQGFAAIALRNWIARPSAPWPIFDLSNRLDELAARLRPGRGRRRNGKFFEVLHLAYVFVALTLRRPTLLTTAEGDDRAGPFFQFITDVARHFPLDASSEGFGRTVADVIRIARVEFDRHLFHLCDLTGPGAVWPPRCDFDGLYWIPFDYGGERLVVEAD